MGHDQQVYIFCLPVKYLRTKGAGAAARSAADARFYMKPSTLKKVTAVIGTLLVTLLLVNSCARSKDPADVEPSGTIPVTEPTTPASPETSQTPDPSGSETPDAQETLTPEPPPITGDPDAQQTPEPDEEVAEAVPGVPVPETESVDDEWFSDAAFLGNSLVDGFRLFSGLTTCDVYAATSMTVLGADSLIQQMAATQYGKVYILLGINEIGYDADYFKEQYAAMLDEIQETQPDADIYIMSLTPVSEYKSSTDSTFTMDRVNLYNEKLLELSEEEECYYIDLVDALADDTGYLPSSVTTDGVHFSASHYQVWLEYLRTHHA